MAMTASPTCTPAACHGPKNGTRGRSCVPKPNTSAMPQNTEITYPVVTMRMPMSAGMERSLFLQKAIKQIYPPMQMAARPTRNTDICTNPTTGLRSRLKRAGRAPTRKTSRPINVMDNPLRTRKRDGMAPRGVVSGEMEGLDLRFILVNMSADGAANSPLG